MKLLKIGDLSIDFFSNLNIVVCVYKLDDKYIECIDYKYKEQFPYLEEIDIEIENKQNVY